MKKEFILKDKLEEIALYKVALLFPGALYDSLTFKLIPPLAGGKAKALGFKTINPTSGNKYP